MAIYRPSHRRSRIERDESRIVGSTLVVADEPNRLIGNHPDAPNAAPAKRSVEMIYRSNRTRRMVGRRKRRWKIECLDIRLPDYRRVNERKVENHIGFGLPENFAEMLFVILIKHLLIGSLPMAVISRYNMRYGGPIRVRLPADLVRWVREHAEQEGKPSPKRCTRRSTLTSNRSGNGGRGAR